MLGSILLLLLYLFSGVSKILNFNNTVNGLHEKIVFNKMPLIVSRLAILCAIIILIVAPLIILYNDFQQKTQMIYKLSGIALIIFTILATLLYHFPTEEGQLHHFLKNTSIIGGLIILTLTN